MLLPMSSPEAGHQLASTTDPVSQGIVGVVLVSLFVLLTLEKAHRVLVALGAVSLLWVITYLSPWHLITFEGAVRHMDFNVLLLLAGMMALVGVLRSTGVFEWMVASLLKRAGGEPERLVVLLLWFTGIISAFADNVTTVIFVTPLAIGAARSLGIRPRAILLPMIFASNIGGTATLVGDPPNIMIGSGAGLSFMDFLYHLAAPVFCMLVMLQWFTLRHFREDFAASRPGAPTEAVPTTLPSLTSDRVLLNGLLVICAVVLVGFLTHGITGMPAAVPAVVGAGAALVLQDWRYLIVHDATQEERTHGILGILEHEIEWPTLAFFTFLFIIVGAAVETGLIERIATLLRDGITLTQSTFALSPSATMIVAAVLILWAAAVLSALIDNIPFVAVSIPIIHGLLPSLTGNGEVLWWALSLGACLGGNGTPVGASANVTTLGLAERAGLPITFRQFLDSSIPVTLYTIVISTLYLVLFIAVGRGESLAVMVALGLIGLVLLRRRARLTRAATVAGLALLLVPALPRRAQAQTEPWRTVRQDHLWLALTYDQPLSTRWAGLGDLQWRRTDGGRKPQQLLFRNTLTYKLTDGLRVGLGVTYAATAPYGALPSAHPSRDRQLFLLAQFNQKLGALEVMHRYRFENRWLADVLPDDDGEGTALSPARLGRRARYLVRLAYPVPRLAYRGRRVQGVLSNDVFVGLSRTDRGVAVDQNRFSFGAGIPLSGTSRLDVLWMQQWLAVPRARANENNRTLWLMLNHVGKAR
jgi:Na+/H+ antiporter NhaD/arsenite permease-like protein